MAVIVETIAWSAVDTQRRAFVGTIVASSSNIRSKDATHSGDIIAIPQNVMFKFHTRLRASRVAARSRWLRLSAVLRRCVCACVYTYNMSMIHTQWQIHRARRAHERNAFSRTVVKHAKGILRFLLCTNLTMVNNTFQYQINYICWYLRRYWYDSRIVSNLYVIQLCRQVYLIF